MDESIEKNPPEEIGNPEGNNTVPDNSPVSTGGNEITDQPEAVAEQKLPEDTINEKVAETITTPDEVIETSSAEIPESKEEPANPSMEAKQKKQTTKRSAAKKTSENAELLSEKDFTDETEAEEDNETEEIATYSSLSKEKLVELLEEIVRDHEIGKIKARVAGIKVAYLNLVKKEKQEHLEKHIAGGGSKEEYMPPVDVLEERYKAAFDMYKEKKALDDIEQEKIKLSNLELKKQILEEIKQLISSEESLKKTYDNFKTLQDKWKGIGQVPRNEIEGLWNNYHFLVEKFFEKVKINKELKDLDLKKNLEQKIQLCEKAEELLLEKSITKSFKLLQKYHDEWKEIGPVMQDKKDEIWERFKNVSDQINAQRKDYYNKLNAEQETNLLAKTALCEKVETIIAEEITNSAEWKTKTEEILEMQELWDSIGRAPAKNNDEIWEKFRSAVNTFFNNKKEFFGELKEQQVTNYNKKIDICNQAEALVNSTNWKQSTAEILKLQQEWRQIGPVPKRYSDKIWKRFRAACDAYFEKKSSYFSNIQENEKENLKKKEELIERIDSFEFSENKNENLDALKNFQREWMEIGHVPMETKEKLQNTYRQAIKQLMEKLQISAVEINTMNYKNRIENLQNSPEAGRALSHERLQLEGRINMLKNDIKLWENNIGFLANSKKANLLKEEFENKINNTKQELALLEAKLKMLIKAKN